MNILIVTNPEHEEFVYRTVGEDFRDGLVFVITNENDYEKFVTGYSYDTGISFMWKKKIRPRELKRAAWFNFHPAPLPEYKGRNLCYHAIMNGETEFGATVHYMDENFDTGDIIETHRFQIAEWHTAGDVSELAISSSMLLFEKYFPRIVAGEEFERIPNVGGTYYKKESIADTINLNSNDSFASFVRAITYGDFYPRIYIGGVTYKIVKGE